MKTQTLGSVTIELTSPDENLCDLANLIAIIAFTNDMTESEIKEYVGQIVEDQYFQSIMNANSK